MNGNSGLETGDWPADVEVAIVAHDSLASLPPTVDALLAADCPPDRITVVDIARTARPHGWRASIRARAFAASIATKDRTRGATSASPKPGSRSCY